MKKELSFILAIPMILTLSLSGTYAETKQEQPIVNGVSEIQRTVYTIHFTDGTAKLVTGAFKHSGGDLSPEIKKQIDDFFANKSAEWKTSLKMANDNGSRNIEAITPTDVRLSVVSFSIDDSNYIRISPTEIIHNHGDNEDHKTQVTTLWDPFGSIKHFAQHTFHKAASFTTSSFHKATNIAKKAANETAHFTKKAAEKSFDFTKKAAIKSAPVLKKIVKIGVPVAGEIAKEGIVLAKNIIPAVVAAVPEMIGGGVADTEITVGILNNFKAVISQNIEYYEGYENDDFRKNLMSKKLEAFMGTYLPSTLSGSIIHDDIATVLTEIAAV